MEEHVYPAEPALDREDDAADAARGRAARRPRGTQGLWAPHLPPEAGGTGQGFLAYAYLNEEIGRSVWAQLVFGCQAPDAGNGEILHLFGTDEQKERWLRPLVAGEIRSFFSMTEPDVSGSDPDGAADARGSRRRRVGDRRAQVVLARARRARPSGSSWRSPTRTPSRTGARRRSSSRPTRPASRSARVPIFGHARPRLDDALRGRLHGRARAGREHARRAGRRLPDRAEAARPRPHPPRHALARARCSARSS